jgi:1-aminocyclopropane-1-carboxylate deaminase
VNGNWLESINPLPVLSLQLPSPIQQLFHPTWEEKKIKVLLKREDLIHPIVSGNKWRKLKYNLERASREGHDTLLSFGGAYSNHIHALSFAAQQEGFRCILVIRGEKSETPSSTLRYAESCGAILHYVSREVYKQKDDATFVKTLEQHYGRFYHIPEGGANSEGIKGCAEIIQELSEPYDYVCTACGTGTTLAGLAAALPEGKIALGIPVLKGGSFIADEVKSLLAKAEYPFRGNIELATDYHFGGYGKHTKELLDFMHAFETKHGLLLDQVYTAKMLYALHDLIEKDYFPKSTTIVALHTGGVQGREGVLSGDKTR